VGAPIVASDIASWAVQAKWHPVGPYVNSSHPDHAALHGSLTVAEIYEEFTSLHEETAETMLAQNREVRRQLKELRKEISDMHNNLLHLHTKSHQSGSDIRTLVLFHVTVVAVILAIMH